MLNGACTGNANPDAWFLDFPKQGRPSRKETEQVVDNAIYALSFCNNCPVKVECLEIGMRHENVENGIWGGTLPGERMRAAGRSATSSLVSDAILMAQRIRERVAVWENIS